MSTHASTPSSSPRKRAASSICKQEEEEAEEANKDLRDKASTSISVPATPIKCKSRTAAAAAACSVQQRSPKKAKGEVAAGGGKGGVQSVPWTRQEDEVWVKAIMNQFKPDWSALAIDIGEHRQSVWLDRPEQESWAIPSDLS
ncbi:hypothetical protein CBOM_01594 [Ceraceosorus bombacis]|uniref:Myb-like domain-containing protein n=1 Tax=Ceraceosorus bombacis TaxID=401625 RepID=A0A0P1BD25_9BASI|nr:hypothetical protein CBOM_01594 [Ceraceosorus bombacis]